MMKVSTLLISLVISDIGKTFVHGQTLAPILSPTKNPTETPTTSPTFPFVTENPTECIEDGEYNSNIDYFPDKVSPEFSTQWDIQYFNHYKILTDENTGTSVVLYLCGTPVPEVAGISGDPVPIPLTGIALSSTPMIAFVEILDLRARISAYVGDVSFISSNCVLSLMQTNDIDVAETPLGLSYPYLSGGSYDSNYGVATTPIYFSEWTESSFRGTFEWVKYLAAMFNVEAEANQRFFDVENRYTCIAETLVGEGSFTETPNVIWAYYSDYCQGWDVGSCPNYYCDFASDCGADLIEFNEPGQGPDVLYCGGPKYTTEQFVRLAKGAKHWIYPATNFDTVYVANQLLLSTMDAVINEQVFDYQGSGENAWFEQRFVEYENVLEDFCEIVGTVPDQDRVWFRNVFTEPVGTLPSCPDPTIPHEPIVTTCILPTAAPVAVVGSGDSGGGACFSANNMVEVYGKKGFVSIDTIMVGDYVKTSSTSWKKDEYSRVISLAHVDNDHETDFLRIYVDDIEKPLEITPLHLIYVSGKATRAGTIRVGDFIDTTTIESRVTKIESVKRVGVYAPITENGDIIISGFYRASSYVAFLDALPYHLQHVLTHQFLSPRRLLCSYYDFNICTAEQYNESGYSISIYWAIEVMEKTNNKFGAIGQHFLASIVMPFLFVVYSFEQMVEYPHMALGILCFYLYKMKKTKNA